LSSIVLCLVAHYNQSFKNELQCITGPANMPPQVLASVPEGAILVSVRAHGKPILVALNHFNLSKVTEMF